MNIKQIIVLCMTLSSSIAAADSTTSPMASVNVTIPTEKIVLTYKQPVRLERVLADSLTHNQYNSALSYPLANQLFNQDKEQQAVKMKEEVLGRLVEMMNQQPTLKTSLHLLIEQIKRWDVGYREFINLDYDAVRLQQSKNPMLNGHYEFIVPERKQHLLIEGLLLRTQKVDLVSGKTVAQYLSEALTLSSASSSYAWVIYPDGYSKKVGYAYWNDEKSTLAPGSTIFIGFDSESTDLLSLEEKIVALIGMRKSL